MSLIFYLSSIPGDKLGPDTLALNMIKKLGHYIIYGVLAVLYLYSLKGRKSLFETQGAFFLLSLCFAFLYAISDEYHQSYIPGRHASGRDVSIDACGALTILVILYIMKTRNIGNHEGDHCHGKAVDH